MKHDWQSWKGGKVYRCLSCQKSYEETDAPTSRDIHVIERAKKRAAGMVLQEDAESGANAEVQENAVQQDEDMQESFEPPKRRLRKRVFDDLGDLDDEFDVCNGEDEYPPEDKRFRFNLVMRPRY